MRLKSEPRPTGASAPRPFQAAPPPSQAIDLGDSDEDDDSLLGISIGLGGSKKTTTKADDDSSSASMSACIRFCSKDNHYPSWIDSYARGLGNRRQSRYLALSRSEKESLWSVVIALNLSTSSRSRGRRWCFCIHSAVGDAEWERFKGPRRGGRAWYSSE